MAIAGSRLARISHPRPATIGLTAKLMDLYLSQDEIAHLQIVAGGTVGCLDTKTTDRLCLIGMIAPTPDGWTLTDEGRLAIATPESA